jgi:hypothetical protein
MIRQHGMKGRYLGPGDPTYPHAWSRIGIRWLCYYFVTVGTTRRSPNTAEARGWCPVPGKQHERMPGGKAVDGPALAM